jgi:hypothetical protein
VLVKQLFHFLNNKDLDQRVKYCKFLIKQFFRCDSFYNIPSSLGKSPKPGIGIGKKSDLARRV